MSDELKRFEKDLRDDPELAQRFDRLLGQIHQSGEKLADGEAVARAAAELGYSFPVSDLEQAFAQAQELDMDELEQVAGGQYHGTQLTNACQWDYVCTAVMGTEYSDEEGHNHFCGAAYHCYTAFMHNETAETNMSCWSDYQCIIWSN